MDCCNNCYIPNILSGLFLNTGFSNFRVIGNDPHGFDRGNDGIGCES